MPCGEGGHIKYTRHAKGQMTLSTRRIRHRHIVNTLNDPELTVKPGTKKGTLKKCTDLMVLVVDKKNHGQTINYLISLNGHNNYVSIVQWYGT